MVRRCYVVSHDTKKASGLVKGKEGEEEDCLWN